MYSHSSGYENTINYLYSLQKFGIKLGLANTTKLLNALGDPHRRFRSIHIAGTNGKGSTASILSSILLNNGIKVGLFTSPHLVSFTERIRINGQQISEPDIICLAAEIRRTIKNLDINPTFFEFVTAMALFYFAQNDVDWAVVETGMGGRLDATNIIEPEVVIITNVSLDHSEFLGESISEIAGEKAGIIKPRIPVVTATTSNEALNIISAIADERRSKLHLLGRDFSGNITTRDADKTIFSYSGLRNYDNIHLPLPGKYQVNNACLAIRACEVLGERGIDISDDSIFTGIQQLRLEGRFEYVSRRPLIILDGAHNPEAAESLASEMKSLFPDKSIILVIGIMSDKNIKEILRPLVSCSDSVILTRADYDRAATTESLKTNVESILDQENRESQKAVTITGSVSEALTTARRLCGEDNVMLITGSFYTTGEAKEILGYKGVLTHLRE